MLESKIFSIDDIYRKWKKKTFVAEYNEILLFHENLTNSVRRGLAKVHDLW